LNLHSSVYDTVCIKGRRGSTSGLGIVACRPFAKSSLPRCSCGGGGRGVLTACRAVTQDRRGCPDCGDSHLVLGSPLVAPCWLWTVGSHGGLMRPLWADLEKFLVHIQFINTPFPEVHFDSNSFRFMCSCVLTRICRIRFEGAIRLGKNTGALRNFMLVFLVLKAVSQPFCMLLG